MSVRGVALLSAALLALTVAFVGCSGADDSSLICPDGLTAHVEFNYYFGLERGNGEEVAEDEWGEFLATEVTPRFPDGLTVFDARGQWLDAQADRLYRERTKVLSILVPAAHERDAMGALNEIADSYIEAFDQQVVFKTSAPSCAGF